MTVYGVDIVHVYADLFSLVIEVRIRLKRVLSYNSYAKFVTSVDSKNQTYFIYGYASNMRTWISFYENFEDVTLVMCVDSCQNMFLLLWIFNTYKLLFYFTAIKTVLKNYKFRYHSGFSKISVPTVFPASSFLSNIE